MLVLLSTTHRSIFASSRTIAIMLIYLTLHSTINLVCATLGLGVDKLVDLSLTVAVLSIVVAVAGLVPLYVDWIRRMRKESSIDFRLLRFPESSKKPVESEWGIRILHPDRDIEKCRVFYDGKPLPHWDNENELIYERMIVKSGGANFRISKGSENEEAEVVVMDGERTLRKRKFKDLPKVPQ